MRHRFRAAHLLTSADAEIVSPGVVDVEDGTVVWSGAADDAPDADAATEAVSGLLMPGFVNIHSHAPMVLLRGAGEGLPVGRWLTEVIWPREARLEAEDVYWGMLLGAAELLLGGITTSSEMYFHADEVARAAVDAGLRCFVSAPIIEDAQLAALGSWRDQLDQVVSRKGTWAETPTIDIGIGPHAAYSTSPQCLTEVGRLAREHDLFVHIHVAEQRDEGQAILDEHGVSVPRYLERLGLLDAHVVAAHGVWLDAADIALFAAHGVGVAHCPCSNGRHASGIAPVRELRRAGVAVGIATDGPVSHSRLDPFEEMRTAIRLAALRDHDAGAMSVTDALRMATEEAGVALGRPDLGHLRPGAAADMVAVDIASSRFGPVIDAQDLKTHLVWSASPADVSDVWVAGRQVVQQRGPTTVDLASAAAESNKRARRLASA